MDDIWVDMQITIKFEGVDEKGNARITITQVRDERTEKQYNPRPQVTNVILGVGEEVDLLPNPDFIMRGKILGYEPPSLGASSAEAFGIPRVGVGPPPDPTE